MNRLVGELGRELREGFYHREIRAGLGDYACSADSSLLMAKANDGVRNDVARLAGIRLVSTGETEAGRHLAEALVKQLTGGDKVTARFLYGEFFEYDAQFKLILGTNHKPAIRGTDNAIWRRIRLVPFKVTIPEGEQDKSLPQKLRRELPGCERVENIGTAVFLSVWRQAITSAAKAVRRGATKPDPRFSCPLCGRCLR
jgi:P4 family phage/plasmid primase-like protien